MFYSPIAWLLLIIFVVQCSLSFADSVQNYLSMQRMGKLYPLPPTPATFAVLANARTGLFPQIISKLFLYIPLLTMGLISREVSSGSIRLLYSSPVKTSRIVAGKFMAMTFYNLLLVVILAIFVVAAAWMIPHADKGMMISGLLGVFLLLSAYAAIGLFMSSLTAYQVVAALSTLAVFAALQYVGMVWQGIDFVRDLTYFLSLGSRTQDMFGGIITSRDVLYFLIITLLFLSFTTLRLRSEQEYIPGWSKAFRYGGMVIIAIGIGYITSRPAATMYIDATADKGNTLSPATQALLKSTGDEEVKMTTYVNLLDSRYSYGSPEARNTFLRTWDRYTRFKPIDYQFYYYYDTASATARAFERVFKGKTILDAAKEYAKTFKADLDIFNKPEASRKIPGLKAEDGRMVMELTYKGKSTFLRMYDDREIWPSEAQFSTALKSLMMPSATQRAGFLTGSLQRNIDGQGERGYSLITTGKSVRPALINNGFEVLEVKEGQEIPENLAVLVVADPKESFSESTIARLRRYVDAGGNLLITTEPGKQPVLEPLLKPLGISLRDGIIVTQHEEEVPDLLMATLTKAAGNMSQGAAGSYRNGQPVMLSRAAALDYQRDSAGFEIEPLLMNTGGNSWLKKGALVSDSAKVELNEKEGDLAGNFAASVALRRKINGKEQRIVVMGDADFMSNQSIQLYGRNNVPFVTALFKWFSGGVYPMEISRQEPKDLKMEVTDEQFSALKMVVLWVLPGLLLIGGTILLVRRKRK